MAREILSHRCLQCWVKSVKTSFQSRRGSSARRVHPHARFSLTAGKLQVGDSVTLNSVWRSLEPQTSWLGVPPDTRGASWGDSTAGRELALHAANVGSIPRIPYGILTTTRHDS